MRAQSDAAATKAAVPWRDLMGQRRGLYSQPPDGRTAIPAASAASWNFVVSLSDIELIARFLLI